MEAVETLNYIAVRQQRKLAGVQKIIAARMVESQHVTASVTAMAEVPAQAVLRAQARLREAGTDVSITHCLIWAVSRCLQAYPQLNGVIQDGVVYEYAPINIGLAVSMPNGDLQAVVIREADQKDIPAIAAEAQALTQRAREGKLGLDDVRGATFTLSNYGSLRHTVWATPIIAPGQSGVLGVARMRPGLVADDSAAGGHIEPILPLSLTYDHRIINGVPAGRFLDDLATLMMGDFTELSHGQ